VRVSYGSCCGRGSGSVAVAGWWRSRYGGGGGTVAVAVW
jgi:hypothetical protein